MSAAEAIRAFGIFVIGYFAVLNGSYMLFTVIAWWDILRHRRRREYLGLEEAFASPLTPPVTVIVPAHNEEQWIVDSVRSLLRLRYPRYEIVVVDDGSTDETLERLSDAFDLVAIQKALRTRVAHQPIEATFASRRHVELSVIRKRNGGTKADAVNAGVNAARYPYICVIDADEILEPDGLLRVARPLLDDPTAVVATGGIVRISNGCRVEDGVITEVRLPKSRLGALQVVEYFRSFVAGRVAWSRLHSLMIISGAFGLFHRESVEAVGGYEPSAIGEDIEMVMRLNHTLRGRGEPFRMVYVPEVVVWTEVPEDRKGLAGQRRRWQRGLADTLWRHRSMLLNPRYRGVGMLGMPFYLLFEFLGPVIEFLGYIVVPVAAILGILNFSTFLAFVLVALVVGVLQSVAALAAVEFSSRRHLSHRDSVRMLLYTVLDNCGYRQWLAFWRFWALIDLARGNRGWGTIQRRGAAAPSGRT
jgi:cellulose synthase/poly-beta-1,6-N-acetylglucosamine synthase-like glycosyltransferase